MGVGDGMNGFVDSMFTGEFLGEIGDPVLRHNPSRGYGVF